MNWRDVFDGDKFVNHEVGSTNIFKVNEFVYNHTYYGYFSFNGTVFNARIPSQLTNDEVTRGYQTGIKVSSLE